MPTTTASSTTPSAPASARRRRPSRAPAATPATATEPCAGSDAGGGFTIAALPAGAHRLRLVSRSGWRQTTAVAVDVVLRSDDAVDSTVRFGVFRLAIVAGAVFADANGNAGRDGGEPALPGWTVFDDADLSGGLGAGEATASSAAAGAYQLTGLGLGAHSVRLRRRCGFAATLPPLPGRYALAISTSGQVIGGRDFGVQPPAVLPGDGNGDRTVSAADLSAAARAVGAPPAFGADADGDGAITAADLPVTASNVFDCAGLSGAPALPTPIATETGVGPTATVSATPPPPTVTATVPVGSTATGTATRSATAPASSSETATRTPTPMPTAVATATSSATSGPSAPPAAALAGVAVQMTNGMSAIPAVITALVGGIQFGNALVFGPDAQLSGVGGPAGACPLGGSASRSCSSGVGGGTLAIDFDGCKVATASGSVTIDALPPTDPALSLRGSVCIANLPLPPWNATIGVSAAFRDAQSTPQLTATAALTGTIAPTLGGSCGATAATLVLTGPIHSQYGDGSAVGITFASTTVVVTVMQFNANCVPIRYRMTFNGPATVTVEAAAAALTSGTAAGAVTAVVFHDFVVEQNASGTPTQTFLDGDIGVACAATTLSFDTIQLLAQAVGQPCPQSGILSISAGAAVTSLIYLPTGQVGLDADNDGFAEGTLDSCQDAPPLCGGGAPTPTLTATRTRTATPTFTATATVTPSPTTTRTNTAGPSPTASATGAATPTAAATATRTPTATPSFTATAAPTPSASPTNPAPQEVCASLPGPALIPDDTVAGITSDIVVGAVQSIADLNVSLAIAHTWVGDLRVILTHVDSGSSVVLLEHPGRIDMGNGCGLDDLDAVFDDAARRPAEDRCAEGPPFAAIDGSVAPLGSLSVFNGQNLSGTWRLNVSDRATQDTGALLGWCLRPNALSPVVTDFTCDSGATECVQLIDEPFTLDFRYADPDGDAATWHLTGRRADGVEFDAGSGPVDGGSGGLMTLNFNPFTCPMLDCPDSIFDYLLTVRDAAGRESPVQRLRLIVRHPVRAVRTLPD